MEYPVVSRAPPHTKSAWLAIGVWHPIEHPLQSFSASSADAFVSISLASYHESRMAQHDPSELVRPAIVMPQTVQRVAVFRIHHRIGVSG